MDHAPVVRTAPRFGDRITIWLQPSSAFWKIGVPVTLALVLLAWSVWWIGERDGGKTFLDELAAALLGAILTLVAVAVVAGFTLRTEWMHARESLHLERQQRQSVLDQALQVGAMRIPGILIVASCAHNTPLTQRSNVEFENPIAPRPDPIEWAAIESTVIPRLEEEARASNIPYFDGLCVDAVNARWRLEEVDGKRKRTLIFTPAKTTYFKFTGMSARLDQPLEFDGSIKTLRQRWAREIRSIEDVSQLPAPASVGVGTAVITRDKRLVLGARGRTFIAGGSDSRDERRRIHIAAEGMLPEDLNSRGLIDPRQTSMRALREEMGIDPLADPTTSFSTHEATGVFFDLLRWQPCFAYVCEVNADWSELQGSLSMGADSWEVEEYVSIPFNLQNLDLVRLLLDEDSDWTLASNHAASVIWFAALYTFGLANLRTALTSYRWQ